MPLESLPVRHAGSHWLLAQFARRPTEDVKFLAHMGAMGRRKMSIKQSQPRP